jgi:hypothetical protein
MNEGIDKLRLLCQHYSYLSGVVAILQPPGLGELKEAVVQVDETIYLAQSESVIIGSHLQ